MASCAFSLRGIGRPAAWPDLPWSSAGGRKTFDPAYRQEIQRAPTQRMRKRLAISLGRRACRADLGGVEAESVAQGI